MRFSAFFKITRFATFAPLQYLHTQNFRKKSVKTLAILVKFQHTFCTCCKKLQHFANIYFLQFQLASLVDRKQC